MVELWKVAFGIAGIAAISTFVLYSLYKDWLNAPAFSTLTKAQRFSLMKMFLVLTFLFALAGLGLSAYENHKTSQASIEELKNIMQSRMEYGIQQFEQAEKDYDSNPIKKQNIKTIRNNYIKSMKGILKALENKRLNVFHDKLNQLNRQLYSKSFFELMPDIEPTLIADNPREKCEECT
ncbi:hypothetical protein SPBRAN_1773 [uncultured Candidatus Thioglobus sp.]|nr:hypothetical protein SPBRAN_1773 [uncultured Candidatus Thioglobus sp.]